MGCSPCRPGDIFSVPESWIEPTASRNGATMKRSRGREVSPSASEHQNPVGTRSPRRGFAFTHIPAHASFDNLVSACEPLPSPGRRGWPSLSVALMAPRPRTLRRGSGSGADRLAPFLFEDVGSPLNGGAKVCQRQLVNEVLGPFVTQCAPNSAHEGATPIQRGFQRGLLNRV
jgi:hypothetical protein